MEEIFPSKKYLSFTADPLEHRMSAASIELRKRVLSSLGAVIPVLDIEFFHAPVQLSIGGSAHIELEPDERANLVTTDFFVDYVIATVSLSEKYALQFSAGHSSDHFSDNWYEFLKLQKSLIYSRDYVKGFVVKTFEEEHSKLYLGAVYAYYFIINHETFHPWTFQCGGEKSIEWVKNFPEFFFALDLKFMQQIYYTASQSYQIGIRYSKSEREYRIAYQFQNGADPRGQYYQQHRRFHSIGLYIEL
ncbi:MAG: DUF1207 domain-containing protein [Bacteroidetes bacterium]|nr:DUF1207 domain-containing protein [Bacteroidota bacterium]